MELKPAWNNSVCFLSLELLLGGSEFLGGFLAFSLLGVVLDNTHRAICSIRLGVVKSSGWFRCCFVGSNLGRARLRSKIELTHRVISLALL